MAMAAGLGAGPGKTIDLALRTGVGVSVARWTLRDMVRANEVVVIGTERVAGCKRPVPVYDLARCVPEGPRIDWSLIDCWAAWPRAVGEGSGVP